jgi:hypothetical protein
MALRLATHDRAASRFRFAPILDDRLPDAYNGTIRIAQC